MNAWGEGLPKGTRAPVITRLLAKVAEDDGGCWIFNGARHDFGYGLIGSGGKHGSMLYAHRVTYEYFIDTIPTDLVIDHLCRIPPCCNPWHLEPVPMAINVVRGDSPVKSAQRMAELRSTKSHCDSGHAFDDVNTYITPMGYRQCRACKHLAAERYNERNRELINQRARKKRGYQGPITHCRRAGHEYTPENTYINPSGKRICIACRRETQRVRRAAKETIA